MSDNKNCCDLCKITQTFPSKSKTLHDCLNKNCLCHHLTRTTPYLQRMLEEYRHRFGALDYGQWPVEDFITIHFSAYKEELLAAITKQEHVYGTIMERADTIIQRETFSESMTREDAEHMVQSNNSKLIAIDEIRQIIKDL